MTRALVTIVCTTFVLLSTACAGGRSCTDLRGSCPAFCAALDGVQGPAGCGEQRSAYQACLSVGTDVCANSCNSEESALSGCVATYCYGHSSDANCATLAASF